MSPLVPLFPPIVPPCIIVYTCISHSQHKRYLYDVVLNCHCGATVYGCAVCAAVLQLGAINLPGHQGAVRHGTRPRAPAGGKGWAKVRPRVPAPKRAQVGTFWPAGVPCVQSSPHGGRRSRPASSGSSLGNCFGLADLSAPVRPDPGRQDKQGNHANGHSGPHYCFQWIHGGQYASAGAWGQSWGVGSGRSHARRRTPYGGGIPGPTSPPAPRIRPRAAGQGGGGRTGAGGPAYQYAPKN